MAGEAETTEAEALRCYNCGCRLTDPTLPLPDGHEWACEDCAADLMRDDDDAE